MSLYYKIIAVDFDGCITYADSYPYVGIINPKAISVLKKYKGMGGKIILWTCRTDKPLADAIKACKDLGLTFDAINENTKAQIDYWVNKYPNMSISNKVSADLYIDDKSYKDVINGEVDWTLLSFMLYDDEREGDDFYKTTNS